ncbi:MAG: efflux RND transporter periplasmic adaptor subunit [Thermodesulfobacteriota bacterium]
MATRHQRQINVARSSFRPVMYVLALLLIATAFSGCKAKEKAAPPVPEVAVVDVVQKDVPISYEWVGTTDGMVNATIRAQVAGYLIAQNYKEGDLVKKGQVLFTIDPRPFEASLQQARAVQAQQESSWQTAQANLKRIRPLAEKNAVSQRDLDNAIGMEQSTHAAMLAAKAAADTAALNLEFTKITSPIDGISGLAKAQIGDLVGPGQIEELTTVSTLDPIKVYIPLSEQEYLKSMENRNSDRPSTVFELILSDGSTYPHKGEFAFADRQIDIKTGTIRVAALFPNPGSFLRPGQYSRIRAQVNVRKDALLVPQRAVSELQGGYLVAVVDKDNKVAIRPVKIGERVGSLWVISEGLNAGERVVAEGVQKVKDGVVVKPVSPAAPGAAAPAATAPHGGTDKPKH